MRRLLIALLVLALLGAAAAGWLLYTESGFAWALARAQRAAGSALSLEGARGSLSGGVTLDRIRYEQEGLTVQCRDAAVALSPLSLVALAPRISRLACADLAVTTGPGGAPSGPPSSLALPLRLHIAEARVGRLTVRGAGDPVEVTGIAFGYAFGAAGHRVQSATLEIEGFRVSGNVAVGAARPFTIEGDIGARREAAPAAELSAILGGSLEALRLSVHGKIAGATAALEGSLTPFASSPIEKLQSSWSELDLKALAASLPRTALAGRLTLARQHDAAELTGEAHVENRLAGPYDDDRLPVESLRTALQTDFRAVRLSGLRAGLGSAGAVTGSGEITAEGAVLALHGAAINLSGLHGRLRATRLAGDIHIAAAAETQSVTMDLTERDVRVALRARRAGDAVDLLDVRARARGGELRGRGRVSMSGAWPFKAEATLNGFDPAAWGDFPAGSVNGSFTVAGSLSEKISIDGEFRLAPSRLHGAPLSGAGRLSLREERLAAAQVEIELGGNRLEARGALGRPEDVLAARLEAPRLAAVDPRLKGQLSGAAQVRGHWRAPAVKFNLSGKDLAMADSLRMATVAAKGEYSPQPEEPLRLAASGAGIAVPGWRLDRVALDADGTRRAHTAILRAHGQGLDLSARARGGWKAAGGWAGTLETLENRGAYPVALEAPVAIEADAGLLRTGAITAQFSGGRLQVREFRYEAGRVSTRGEFSQLGAGVLLALAGGSPAAAGTLKLSGAWALNRSPRWNGTATLRRDSGDLSIGEAGAPIGLETLTVDALITDDRLDARGVLRAKAASGRFEGSVRPVETPEGMRLAPSSPVRLTANVDIDRLAALAGLVESSFRVDGRVRAAFTADGTVSDPLLSGRIEGDALSLDYPPEGVALRGGELRARLGGREIRLESFSIIGGEGVFRARGAFASGREERAAVQWEAERLRIMGRPDRRLVVTGRGHAALEGGKVSLGGELRADEGLIELRTATLPAPGDDVVVEGRPRTPAEAPTLQRAALDLALDFGSNFRIRGRGLDSLLAGKIRIVSGPAGNLLAKGAVRTVKGTYMAFGQRLELERGRLIFDGPVENPALDIRAMRKLPSVEAGVEVAGTLRSPFVRVVSDPPMPENDALSWLILGHGPGEASGGDLTMLPMAAAALLGRGDSSPGSGMARKLGVDSIGLRRGGAVGEQFVTVGKRISDDIYVVYEQSLGATANVLKLEFNLTQRLLLRAETGETSAVGLFYRWAFD
jgi:translocation and assembly module TamB